VYDKSLFFLFEIVPEVVDSGYKHKHHFWFDLFDIFPDTEDGRAKLSCY